MGGESARLYRADHVILCGGAVHSPAILQRSGVGPAALLNDLGIPLIAELPVGVSTEATYSGDYGRAF